MANLLKITVFSNVTSSYMVDVHRRFGRTCSNHVMIEEDGDSTILRNSLNIYQTKWRHIPDDSSCRTRQKRNTILLCHKPASKRAVYNAEAMKGVCSASHCFACITVRTISHKVCILSVYGQRAVSSNTLFLKAKEHGKSEGPELHGTERKWHTCRKSKSMALKASAIFCNS